MSQPNSNHFHNGKAARFAGKPCVISDARMLPASRQEWYDGWNHQDALMRPVPSEAEIAQNESFLDGLKSELKQASTVPCFKHFCRRCSSLHYIAKTEPINPRCCGSIMAYRGHATAVPAKLLKGQYQEAEV